MALVFDDQERTLTLGVQDLLLGGDAGPKSGHLTMRVTMSSQARMRAGSEAHRHWQGDRESEDSTYRSEVMLKHRLLINGWEVLIRGRVDGLSHEDDITVVEEVKTTAMEWDDGFGQGLGALKVHDVPTWTLQLQLYLYFLSSAQPAEDFVGRLVVLSLVDGSQRLLHVPIEPGLVDRVREQLEWVIARHEEDQHWMAVRNNATVVSPHAVWRKGQESLANDIEEVLHQGKHLLLSAPTGYGKTAAALTAAMRFAYATNRRLFFATARTTQQRMAREAVAKMADAGMPVRLVQLRAKEKVCLNEQVSCRSECCEFADQYHDKVRNKRPVEQLWPGVPTSDEIETVASEGRLCPFALSLEMVPRADVVIGDLNYLFDPAVRLASIGNNPDGWIVIVDEAHNLPDRGMGYGSAELSLSGIRELATALSEQGPEFEPFFALVDEASLWLEDAFAAFNPEVLVQGVALPLDEALDQRMLGKLTDQVENLAFEYAWVQARADVESRPDDPWHEFARTLLRLRTLFQRAGDETVAIWRSTPARSLSLLCRDPSWILGPVFDGVFASVCMSATLAPASYYRDMMGVVPARTVSMDVESPFPPENSRFVLLPEVSTEYRHRQRDRHATADLISRAIGNIPGNVAVFFPSFSLMESIAPLLDLAGRPVLQQARFMDDQARDDLLQQLMLGRGHLLLAVMGGIFGEGVDFAGDALNGAVIVGPGLPTVNLERRLMESWFQSRYEKGHQYAWLVPGMCRVVQAAGRVVRSADEKGAIVLVGRRFLLREIQNLLPAWWFLRRTRRPEEELVGFWESAVE